MQLVNMKRCNKCKIEKELECFYDLASQRSRSHICKDCFKKKHKEMYKRVIKRPTKIKVLKKVLSRGEKEANSITIIEERTKKDKILILSRYFGRYPTVVEVYYFEVTGQVKEVKHFTKEEHALYNPSPRVLGKVYKYISGLLYVWAYRDKIRAYLEREKIKEARNARIEAREKELHKRWEEAKIKRLIQSKTYISNRCTPTSERALKRQTTIDNKRRIKDVLNYHTETGIAIPEEMWGVIGKYR